MWVMNELRSKLHKSAAVRGQVRQIGNPGDAMARTRPSSGVHALIVLWIPQDAIGKDRFETERQTEKDPELSESGEVNRESGKSLRYRQRRTVLSLLPVNE